MSTYPLDRAQLTKLHNKGIFLCSVCGKRLRKGQMVDTRPHGGGKVNWPKHTKCVPRDSRPK